MLRGYQWITPGWVAFLVWLPVLLISAVHFAWGALILIVEPPQPFGAFQPFLRFITEVELAWIFIVTSAAPHLVAQAFRRNLWAAPISCLPQQVILLWSLGASFATAEHGIGSREVYALAYTIPWSLTHAIGVGFLWRRARIGGAHVGLA